MNPFSNMVPIDTGVTDAPYAEAAPDNGKPPVLLVHGFLSSRGQWLDNMEGLSEFSRPVIMELHAHGRSPAPETAETLRTAYFVECIDAVRRAIGADKLVLCGHSFGAAVLLNYALAYPEHVHCAIVTNSTAAFRKTTSMEFATQTEVVAAGLEARGQAALEQIPFHPRFMKYVSDRVLNEIINDSALIDPAGIARALRSFHGDISVRHRFHTLRVPVLLLNGEKEKGFQADRNWAAEALPSLTIEDFPELGHNLNAEAPDVYNDRVVEFMRRHVPNMP